MPTRRAFLKQAGLGAAGLGLFGLLPGCKTSSLLSSRLSLARSTPEAEGISSEGILEFLDALARHRHEFHSLMIVKNGRVAAEGWWAPYAPELNHTMYSMSKSFTSTAIGFAVSEGRLGVEDRVISFFPEELPARPSQHLQAMRIKDLLTMSTGHERDTLFAVIESPHWVKTFLEQPVQRQPGTHFVYNSGASYMLSAILQKVAGQTMLDYLRPRLFDPLGIEGMTWESCPRGIHAGGWGLSLRTEGLAKFGQLYLQNGSWRGRSLLPVSWVEEATSAQVQQPPPPNPARRNEDNDWLQGYGYQFWRCRHNGYRGDGAFGQYTLVFPEKGTVIAITGESPDMQGTLDLVWKHLLPAIRREPLPENRAARDELENRLQNLRLPLAVGDSASPRASAVSGRSFQLEPNSLGLHRGSLTFEKDRCVLTLSEAATDHSVSCGHGRWEHGFTTIPGTPPRLVAGGRRKAGTASRTAASGAWKDENTFEMLCRYNETPHHDLVTCSFEGDQVKIAFQGSIARHGNRKDSRPVLAGTFTR